VTRRGVTPPVVRDLAGEAGWKMFASTSGKPRFPARCALSGVPPTPSQTGSVATGRGETTASWSGGRKRPCQVTGSPAFKRRRSSSFSAKIAS
jgi:hypothetical protein